MTEPERKTRNSTMLSQCSDLFRPKAAAIIADLETHGKRPRIQEAWRSPADQIKDFESGHSQLRFGFHNITSRGKAAAFAVDILDDDHPLGAPTDFLLMLFASAKSHGCSTGIEWGLPLNLRLAIEKAIAAKNWLAQVKIGWDSSHVEPSNLTPQQAQREVN